MEPPHDPATQGGSPRPRTDRLPRQRLDADTRRETILSEAASAFRAAPYAEVKVADVATGAAASPALVYRYFGTKPGLYAAVLERAAEDLAARQAAALSAVDGGAPIRDRVRALLEAYVDHVAADPTSWSNPLIGGDDPPEAIAVRRGVTDRTVDDLRAVLNLSDDWARDEYALRGYLGFVDQACLHWVSAGCPDDQRWAVVEASLGALQGALGDWRG